ncbi:MAG: mechanosensitive ion channel family protein [Alcaligenes sp.]
MEHERALADLLGWQRIEGYLPQELWVQVLAGIGMLALLVWFASWITSSVLSSLVRRILKVAGKDEWARALVKRRFVRHVGYAVPLLVVASNLALLPLSPAILQPVARLFLMAFCVFVIMAIVSLLGAWQDVYANSSRGRTKSIKGYIEVAKIGVWAIGFIVMTSILLDQSPVLLLSGLGALSAVLLLVFKDTLLSLVASTQMSSNDMLRIGDWIEMKQANADGFVIDIALHTVKVQNWDKTVTTIPTYKLFSESYRNWRQMFESGGRRIKRTLSIDASSVRFLTPEEVGSLSRFALLRDYLEQKQREIEASNQELGRAGMDAVNYRRLTNLGTFRAYCMAYIKRHPEVHQDMIQMVRMMEPTADGIPVEVYCFTNKTAWVDHERIQGDIFDHFLSILPEMGLRLFQSPTGRDLSLGLSLAAESHRPALGQSDSFKS